MDFFLFIPFYFIFVKLLPLVAEGGLRKIDKKNAHQTLQ